MSEDKFDYEKITEEILISMRGVQKGLGNSVVIELFEKKILKVKSPKLSYYFARDIEGADILAHGNVVINSGDEYWIEKFNDLMREKNIQYFADNNKKILSITI